MELFTMTQLLIYFLTTLQITYTAVLPPRTYNQNSVETKSPKNEPRLSLADSAEWTEYNLREPEGPGTYSFGYDVEDPQTGNIQFRTEERSSNGTVTGSYGYVTTDGSVYVVHYIADIFGYRTKIEEAKLKSQRDVYQEINMSENISPQMKAAIQSLQNKNGAKEEEHSRPNSNKIVNTRKEDTRQESVAYNVQYFPSQTKLI